MGVRQGEGRAEEAEVECGYKERGEGRMDEGKGEGK